KTHPAKVVRADSRNDVALLKLEGEGFSPLSLAQSIPEMGDKVFTIGYPNPGIQGSAAKYTDGAVSALSGLQDDIRTMQITASNQAAPHGLDSKPALLRYKTNSCFLSVRRRWRT
ncbi:MAG: serine protease, partial [bacterium]